MMAKGKMKSVYGIYKKHGREAFLDAAEYYSSHTMTEAEKMVEDYNNGNTILNDDCLAFVDAGQSFGM